MNIFEKINAIMDEVKSLKKDGKVAYGNTKYNYLSEAKTTEIIRSQLVKHKLVLLPISVTEEKQSQVTHGIYTYRLVNAENPEEYIELMAGGQGHDSADKGSGKASSYAYKYLMWRLFAIPSNDDPDQISSDEIVETEEIENSKIDKDKLAAINDMINSTKTDIERFCKHFKVKSVNDLTNKQWIKAMELLGEKAK